jgi:hypothetical protein
MDSKTRHPSASTPMEEADGHGDLKPEWLRMPQAVQLFGISRAKLYDLINKGRIKSVSLRERGQTKGTRLLSYDSLHAYLEELAERQSS